MNAQHNRYYIELYCDERAGEPRKDMELRRQQAAMDFVSMMQEWVRETGCGEQISNISVTPMGQVMLVCTPVFVRHIRSQDVTGISSIREGSLQGEIIRRLTPGTPEAALLPPFTSSRKVSLS
ncbi:MAG: hypothetical protein IPI58_02850 [Alphaproteobacteria bacterium]|nr:MAG: hypothetical protein IPI58_02850 [Alphaproteobacteria bacterium]